MVHTVVHVDASAADLSEGPHLMQKQLTAAIDREEPFAAVIVMPTVSGQVTRKGGKLAGATNRVRMLKQLRPGLKKWCRGLAFVADADAQKVGAKAIASGDRLWGCPTFTTDDDDAARAWATSRITATPGENR
ncbi:MAG: hypothetical protein ACTH8X_01205 [Corynebacterium variabile]|uniref:hypothetical protein n=1 Tax=Corynebacterium variabile TaxID=1727 RepID=UPI003FB6D99A